MLNININKDQAEAKQQGDSHGPEEAKIPKNTEEKNPISKIITQSLDAHLKELFDDFKKDVPVESILPEKEVHLSNGWKVLGILLSFIVVGIILLVVICVLKKFVLIEIPILIIIIPLFFTCCLQVINPGEAKVISYYGTYLGTCKENGYFWIRPCSKVDTISLKSNHYNGNLIKVNDKNGTPVLLGITFIWKIKDSVKVIFGVNDYQGFLRTQTESAVRFIGSRFPYDSANPNEVTLKSGREEINNLLKLELQRRINIAGIEIQDARVTELSYSSEVAEIMLKKQAAESIVQSKEKISKGSIDIIESSIKELETRKVCTFSNEQKTKIAANLLMILNNPQGNNSYVKINLGE